MGKEKSIPLGTAYKHVGGTGNESSVDCCYQQSKEYSVTNPSHTHHRGHGVLCYTTMLFLSTTMLFPFTTMLFLSTIMLFPYVTVILCICTYVNSTVMDRNHIRKYTKIHVQQILNG